MHTRSGSRNLVPTKAHGYDPQESKHGRGDIAAIARGFGLRGEKITSLNRFEDLFAAHKQAGQAELWDLLGKDLIIVCCTAKVWRAKSAGMGTSKDCPPINCAPRLRAPVPQPRRSTEVSSLRREFRGPDHVHAHDVDVAISRGELPHELVALLIGIGGKPCDLDIERAVRSLRAPACGRFERSVRRRRTS